MYYIYIIYSIPSDIYYIGHSSDPWKRVVQHNENTKDKFTGKHSNWVLRAVFKVSENKGEADRLEKFLKKQKSRVLLEKLINPEFELSGKLAQLVRVPKLRD